MRSFKEMFKRKKKTDTSQKEDEMFSDDSGMVSTPEPAEPHTPRVVKSSTGKNSCPVCKTGYMPWITYCPPCGVPLQDL